MRKLFLIIVISFIPCVVINAQGAWQIISDPESGSLAANFKSPPPEYGMILWWGWDGPMTDTVIKRDLDRIKAMGFRGVMIEAGYGMTAKYLSTEWFLLVKQAVDEAKKRNMIVWVEDEGKYPSGFAGGKFSNERPDLKMQGLVITEKIDVTPSETIKKKLPPYVVSAAAFNSIDKTTKVIDISSGEINWLVPEGRWQIFVAGHRFRSSQTRSVNNPTRGKDTTASLMDYLNPLATKQFLDWTHEQYKKYIGNEFGKTFLGFMGDEPDFAYTPWTPKILEEFKARKDMMQVRTLLHFLYRSPMKRQNGLKPITGMFGPVFSGIIFSVFRQTGAGKTILNILFILITRTKSRGLSDHLAISSGICVMLVYQVLMLSGVRYGWIMLLIIPNLLHLHHISMADRGLLRKASRHILTVQRSRRQNGYWTISSSGELILSR